MWLGGLLLRCPHGSFVVLGAFGVHGPLGLIGSGWRSLGLWAFVLIGPGCRVQVRAFTWCVEKLRFLFSRLLSMPRESISEFQIFFRGSSRRRGELGPGASDRMHVG